MSMRVTLTKKELATAAGYSYRRLYDIDAELPKGKKLFEKCEDGKYDLAAFVQRWVEYNLNRKQGEEISLEEAKTIHEQVKIEKAQLEVARMRGELVDVNEVRQLWGNVANTVVQNMIRLPGKIAQQVFLLDNMELVTGIIDKEIRDVLVDISETPLPNEAAWDREDEENQEEE